MKYALIFSVSLLSACGQQANSSAKASQVNPVLVEPRIEDLAGKKIVYVSSHPFGAEIFETSGRWSTDISLRAPLYLYGSWRQHGLEICVDVEKGNWGYKIIGETICREIQPRPEGLFIETIVPLGKERPLQFAVEPID